MKFTRILILYGFLLGASSLQAIDLSLVRAEQMALDHSQAVRKARAESQAYQDELRAARAGRYPTISLDATALYNSEVSQLSIQVLGNSLEREIGLHENYQANLRAVLPLYTGGKIASSIDFSQANAAIREALLQKSTIDVKFMARSSYLELDKADKLTAAARSALKRAELVEKDVNSMLVAGVADSVDLYDAQMAVNNARLGLDRAESARRSREITLAILLGIDPAEALNLTESFGEPRSAPVAAAAISEDKPELTGARSAIDLSESIIRVRRAEYAPDISLFAGYAYGKPNLSPFEEDFNGNATVGASLNWSFNLGGRTASRVGSARYLAEASREEYDRLHQELTQQAQVARESLDLVYRAYKTAYENHRIARANFRLARVKHREGVLSANRLLEIEASLSQAEAMLSSTEADYRLALTQYEYLIGKPAHGKGE